jgi:hypothetical protein
MDLRIHVGAVKDFILRAKNQSEASVTHLGSANEAINYRIETSKNPIRLEMVRGGIPERTLILYWPLEPCIDRIINESEGPEGTASGKTTGGYRVRIKGQNLQLVNEVKFDATVINQIQEQTNDTLIISVPPGQGKVFVTLKTPPILDGTPLTNQKDWDKGKGFFTYIAPSQSVAQNSP